MKQALTFMIIGIAGVAASLAMSVGQPAQADIAIIQAATQPLVVDGVSFLELED